MKAASRGAKASKDRVGLNPGAIKQSSVGDYAIRFAFGAAVSVTAGLVSLRFGPRVGGVFLAFPAILPAALSLIEKRDGPGPADADAQGGVLGALGLVIFALVVLGGIRSLGVPLTLALALGAWALVSAGLYLILRRAWPTVWR
ncbi:MAG: DUF3147 family protein [Candidatus Dormibacteraeota bacterium]|nr:DUF3147 family protein [Candidatus Dormibacteraeota bacterium]